MNLEVAHWPKFIEVNVIRPSVLMADELNHFVDPRLALADGILDMSDDLSVDRLLEAYSFGIFPWPHPGYPTLWFSPEQRGVLDFSHFHVPRSLSKLMRGSAWRVSVNEDFSAVIRACAAQPRAGQSGTWINSKILKAYEAFHRAGYVWSVEVRAGNELVGGLYGVYVAGVFCGESMFHLRPNASKVALVCCVEMLRQRGLKWMDIQMVTPLLEAFGGNYISRASYLERLEKARPGARALFGAK